MNTFADLEISINRQEPGIYSVDFRYSQPDSDTDVRLGQGSAQIDVETLAAIGGGSSEYGQKLTGSLFADPAVLNAFTQALTNAQTLGIPMRIRLLIGPGAEELHLLHWESLRNPQDDTPLSTNANILFSRYLSSLDWRPVRISPKGDLHTLIMIASPTNLADYNLAPIEVKAELERTRQVMGTLPVSALPETDSGERATLNNLFARLHNQFESEQISYDILYLVCHGVFAQGEPWLWLEDADGKALRVSGHDLVTRFKELSIRPRLIVLGSCESAAPGSGAALSALAPRLAQAGIPAVVAMQGKISLDTLSEFMFAFFDTLQKEGEVDLAMNIARSTVRARPDHWMPALFMRLKSGRIWYVPGFSGDESAFEKWESIASAITEGSCTAILGPGLTEPLLGRRSDMAKRWAEKHGYPLSPYDQEDLPRVAQYIVTRQDPNFLRTAYRDALRDEILRRYATTLPAEVAGRERWSTNNLLDAIELSAKEFWSAPGANPFAELASLKLPIYITASYSDLLANALIAAGADPQVRLCPWNELIPKPKCVYTDEPTPEKPLVYHLFGHLSTPFSMVITEDEFFDYLIGVTINKELIPEAVRAAMTSTALLFLGFRMDDWYFRVLFRMIMAQGGREMLKYFSHAAAQIEPEEGRIIDVERTRRYLEKYFDSEHISLYWGSSEDFLGELHKIRQTA